MLILTRRVKEAIRINDDIEIIVHKIRGQQVSLGIVAPKDVAINREEIYQKIQAEKDNAY